MFLACLGLRASFRLGNALWVCLLQAKERAVKFPALPMEVRAEVAPFLASDLALWRHARAILFQRASSLLAPGCVPSRMLDNKLNPMSCGSAVRPLRKLSFSSQHTYDLIVFFVRRSGAWSTTALRRRTCP